MNKIPLRLLTLLLLASAPAFAQKKLKKSDRTIVSNMHAHIGYLTGDRLGDRKAGSDGEKLADEYIIKQFSKSGLKPHGEKEWYQAFNIYDGKEIKPSTSLTINDQKLELYKDYFPLAYSANKNAEAAVAIALSENGVPWFKDIKELINDDDTAKVDTFDVIRKKAKAASSKGASALIVYSKSGDGDIEYNRYDQSQTIDIPVLYITSKAFKKYADDESAILDVKLNVELEPKNRTGNNVVGYADNGADSTIVTSAHLGQETAVAALIETARLMKANKSKNKNYLYVAYCGEKDGQQGEQYFNQHLPADVKNIKTVSIDSVATTVEDPKELNLVKRSVEILKNN